MWLILQQKKASDYVLATGKTTSVRDFVSKCFNEVGIQISFTGKDEKEVGRLKNVLVITN